MTNINTMANAKVVVETNAASTAAEAPATCPATTSGDAAKARPASGTAEKRPAYANVPPSFEAAHFDQESIAVRSRGDFVKLFRACEAKTALATLEMCRAVYEAHKVLSEAEFEAFCGDVGYKDTSSTIRKFLAIGKVAPRLFVLAEKLPANWTSIYMLTQIPATVFEKMVEAGRIFKAIKTSDVSRLVKETRIPKTIAFDPPGEAETTSFTLATVSFNKYPIDDLDYRAVRKAFAEIESRLPIRFHINKATDEAWQKRKDAMYADSKFKFTLEHFRPDLWDFGREANAVARKSLTVAEPTPAAATGEQAAPALKADGA